MTNRVLGEIVLFRPESNDLSFTLETQQNALSEISKSFANGFSNEFVQAQVLTIGLINLLQTLYLLTIPSRVRFDLVVPFLFQRSKQLLTIEPASL